MAPKKRNRRKLGARQYKNYTEEMLGLAIEMVKSKKITSYEAEKNFGIPRRTIEKKNKKIHSDKPGPPFRLTPDEELNFVKVLTVASEYGAPLTQLDLRIVVYEYLKKNNKNDTFDDKLPGEWWAKNFIARHHDKLSLRAVQNIKRARAEKTKSEFEQYFNNLEFGKSITTSDLKQNNPNKTNQTKKNLQKLLPMNNENLIQMTCNEESKCNAKIEDCSGKISEIQVNICGSLSDDGESDIEHSTVENKATTAVKENKQSKLSLKKHFKKNIKNPAKRFKRISSGSTTTVDSIEWSKHSDSEIEWLELGDSDIHDIEEDDTVDVDVKKRVDELENNIFKEIIKRDLKEREDMENCQDIIEDENIFCKDQLSKERYQGKKGKNKSCENYNEELPEKTGKKKLYGMFESDERATQKSAKEVLKETENLMPRKYYVDENRVEWGEGDTILARYYSRKWKYYVGVIKNINRYKKMYSVSYYKQIHNKNGTIKFITPKKPDEDKHLPEDSIVKSIELLQISEHPDEFVLMNDEDNIYFN